MRTILGSYPPAGAHWAIGQPENYYIHDGYQVRLDNAKFDDTVWTDEYQREVYQFAREVADRDNLTNVTDIGCGSGFKLVTNFYNFKTIGIDIPDTIKHCRRAWPDRRWEEADWSQHPFGQDLVISSDVIEHLPYPEELLIYIEHINPKRIVLSTPERNLLAGGHHNGPPKNPAHVREWSFAELHAFVGLYFRIDEHFVLDGTQVILASHS